MSMEFHVAVHGHDRHPGTSREPFATLEGARDALRRLKQAGQFQAGGVTVWVHAGRYSLATSFALDEQDSGTDQGPIIYRACPGDTVQILGGREVDGFVPVSDPAVSDRLAPAARQHIVQCDLQAQGISDYGQLRPRGMNRPSMPAAMELFFQGQAMTLARWPNNDWTHIAGLPADAQKLEVNSAMVTRHATSFLYEGDRPRSWAPSQDIWVHGFFSWDWADTWERVAAIDLDKRQVTTAPPHHQYQYSTGKHYYFVNILEELDAPGEYFIDRARGILYFWPPAPLAHGQALVSIIEQPLIVMRDVSYVTLRGLTLECTRGHGVHMIGGQHNLVAGCTLRNIANDAVVIQGGQHHGVQSCEIYQIGERGVELTGGDRKTLTPGHHFAINNHIHHFSRSSKCYKTALYLTGVGNRAAHNHIHDAPHEAIYLCGNDHLIEFNDVHHVCLETGDAGAFHTGRDWTWRGNVIRFNYWHHNGGIGIGSMAVYLDDWSSGFTVHGNIFYQLTTAVLIGSGRDNRIENNVFVDCQPAIHLDARGTSWARKFFDGRYPWLFDKLKEMNHLHPPYSTRYPQLHNILDDEPILPKGNTVLRNICMGGKWLSLLDGLGEEILEMRDNLVNQDPHFVDPQQENWQLRDDSPAFALGFVRIPTEKIGLMKDEYRP